MSERPILIFPSPTTVNRFKGNWGNPRINKPSTERQVERLETRLNSINGVFRDKVVAAQAIPNGYDPDMVLVFEVKGSVAGFFEAVNKIPELEWMGEYEEVFAPDNDFYDTTNIVKNIDGKIYFVMSNYTSLQRILNLWNNYKNERAPARGFTPWRNLFILLYDVRLWGLKDRLEETGISADIAFRLQNGQGLIPFEIELWYRTNENSRRDATRRIQELLELYGGNIISEAVINGISYHAILGEAPSNVMAMLNDEADIELFKADEVMFFRPVGQSLFINDFNEQPEIQITQNFPATAIEDPIVALLDGVPLQNHTLLRGRIIVNDTDGFEADYPADKRLHGTGMASIIIHGDINTANDPIKSFLYVRPVMKYLSEHGTDKELIPENMLTVDLIHRAVKEIFDDERLKRTIKVINISLGDRAQPFHNRMSSWAKLLDWLSFQYNVLFIVSAGNCDDDIDFQISSTEYGTLIANNTAFDTQLVTFINDNARFRKILSPAESINALTVGSTHEDSCPNYNLATNISIFNNSPLFSPVSRLGSGYRRSIKPDVLMPGGRVLFRDPLTFSRLKISGIKSSPGVKVASPEAIDRTVFTRGTSNAAALLSRSSAILHQALDEDRVFTDMSDEYFPVIAKTLLTHSSSWNLQDVLTMSNILNLNPPINHSIKKAALAKYWGYGKVDQDRVFSCTQKRVTLMSYGMLSKDGADLYEFPLPPSLSGMRAWKRLIVTLGWITPVNPKNQLYRKAKLWFDFPDDDKTRFLAVDSEFYDHNAASRGTIQHEMFATNNASAYGEHSTIKIRVNCREDASKLTENIRYGLAVTLETDETGPEDIYTEIKQAIQERNRIQPRTN